MCNKPAVLTHDWIKAGGRSILVNAVTVHVGTRINFSGNPTYQAQLVLRGAARTRKGLLPDCLNAVEVGLFQAGQK